MSEELQIVCLARHGETAWSLTGQHTGLTDLPLTERGERNAHQLGERLRGLTFARVGIDVDALAAQLQDEGAKSFVKSWDELMEVIASKSAVLEKTS